MNGALLQLYPYRGLSQGPSTTVGRAGGREGGRGRLPAHEPTSQPVIQPAVRSQDPIAIDLHSMRDIATSRGEWKGLPAAFFQAAAFFLLAAGGCSRSRLGIFKNGPASNLTVRSVNQEVGGPVSQM